MKHTESSDSRYESRVRKTTIKLAYWTGAWVLSTAVLAFGPRFVWNEAASLTLAALAVSVLAGFGMILANKDYLDGLDELQKKVHFDAMGITLGVALVLGTPGPLLAAYGVIEFQPEIAHLIVLMGLTFLTSVLLGLRRYR
jgi:hypothetical protein